MNAEQRATAVLAAINAGQVPAGFTPVYQLWQAEDSCGECWEWADVSREDFERADPRYLGDVDYRRILFAMHLPETL